MKNVEIKITLTDDNITLDGKNLTCLSQDDIIDSIKMLVSLAETLGILREGDNEDGKCVNSSLRYTRMVR